MRRPTLHRFENLESRLAMAGLVAFTDVDGDIVTVQTNRGTNALLAAAITLSPQGTVGGFQLRSVILTDPAFARTNLTITARPGTSGGNGQVDVGEILSSLDLGRVTVGGDIGRIQAGDSNLRTSGMAAFTVKSIGVRGTVTGAPDFVSAVNGSVPMIRVASHLVGFFQVGGRAADVVIGGSISGINASDGFLANSIGRMTVGESIYGGTAVQSGAVFAGAGGITRLVIGGNVIGGAGERSGSVLSAGRIGFAKIGGSVIGANGVQSGSIMNGSGGITRLVVGGSIVGGSVDMSGSVTAYGSVGSITVGGSMIGSNGNGSGVVYAPAGIGTLDIAGSLSGGIGLSSGSVAGTRIGTLRLGGIQAGDGPLSGAVRAISLGTMVVRGDIMGSALQPAIITALGSLTPTGPRAIGSLTVWGSMTRTLVLGGYAAFGAPAASNAVARIGAVTVQGNMTSSSIVAGVENIGGTPHASGMPQFGDGFDVPIAGRGGSRIDSLVVNGTALGDADPTLYSGVLANSIGSVRLGGVRHTPTRAGIAPTSGNLVFRLIP